jgi:hypothetical protein
MTTSEARDTLLKTANREQAKITWSILFFMALPLVGKNLY